MRIYNAQAFTEAEGGLFRSKLVVRALNIQNVNNVSFITLAFCAGIATYRRRLRTINVKRRYFSRLRMRYSR